MDPCPLLPFQRRRAGTRCPRDGVAPQPLAPRPSPSDLRAWAIALLDADLARGRRPDRWVADAIVARPHHCDLDIAGKFMLVSGPISSIFDIATFGVLLWVLQADEALCSTGRLAQSLSILVAALSSRCPFRCWSSSSFASLVRLRADSPRCCWGRVRLGS
jgi:hypothetical protein